MKHALRGMVAAACLTLAGLAQASAATLTIAQNFDPQTLWPNGTTASDNLNAGAAIVESLFWQSPKSNKLEPLLALSWRQETPTTVLIALRQGVSFTNGEPMNADAVVHSIEVFADKKLSPAYARVAESIERAEKVDDHTVRVRLRYPSPTIGLALSQIYITPPKYWAQLGAEAYGQKPIGTGPFRFVSWARDNQLVMDKNPSYWGEAPKGIDRLIWRPIPDETARISALMAGEVDLAKDLPVSAIPEIEQNPKLTLMTEPSYRIFQIILSSLEEHKSPLQDKRVRQAVNYAIDKQAIIDTLFAKKATPLHGQLLRPTQLGYNPALKDYPFDPAKAKQLLAEAGYPNGFEIVFKTPAGRYVQDREVSEAVAGMLAKVGIKTKMVTLEPGEFLRQLRARELAPMAFLGLAPDDDPDFQMAQYHSTWRYAYVKNPELDRMIDAGKKEMDAEKRAAIYRDMMVLVRDEAPVAFLYDGVEIFGANSKLKGFKPRGDGRIFLYGSSLAN